MTNGNGEWFGKAVNNSFYAGQEKMKAAQEKFASSLQSTQEGHSMEKGHPVATCALCRDSSSDSPLCLLTFVQV